RDVAVALVRHLLGREVQGRLATELGWFSARRDVAVNSGGLLSGFVAMRDAVRPRPERVDYPVLSREWQQAFRAVVFEGADPASASRWRAASRWPSCSRRASPRGGSSAPWSSSRSRFPRSSS